MPTLYKAQLTERIDYEIAFSTMRRSFSSNSEKVLALLNFQKEHGSLGDWHGKFDFQIQKEKELLLDEIAAILAKAFLRLATMPAGILLTSLQKIAKQPSLAFSASLPGDIDWALASNYQRDKEKPGTFCADIMHIHPASFDYELQLPTETRIAKAAVLASEKLKQHRKKGKPNREVIELLAHELRMVFERSGQRATRVSEFDNKLHCQIERGSFLAFVKLVLPALQAVLLLHGLPSVSASTIAKRAGSPTLAPA